MIASFLYAFFNLSDELYPVSRDEGISLDFGRFRRDTQYIVQFCILNFSRRHDEYALQLCVCKKEKVIESRSECEIQLLSTGWTGSVLPQLSKGRIRHDHVVFVR